MMKRIAFLLSCLAWHAAASAESFCHESDDFSPAITLELKHAYLSLDDRWIGVFELINHDITPSLAVSLERGPEGLAAIQERTVLEFKDMNNRWVLLSDDRLPGTFFRDPKLLTKLEHGKRLEFRYPLFRRDVLDHAGAQFKLKLHLESPTECVASFPFMALPAPAPATGLRTIPQRRPSADTKAVP